ncbi:MAG: rhomboid family intramembrane serine protease [Draconibacterium sp.]|jgi:membrane associated rhomboid family serine protease
MNYRPAFNSVPVVVKNLIIVNVLMLLGTFMFDKAGINLYTYLGLHFPLSDKFRPHQIFTHMFMHGDITHLFFNMFALYMFGRVLESVWGPKRFLLFYLVTGIGAAVIHSAVNFIEYYSVTSKLSVEEIEYVKEIGYGIWAEGKNFSNELPAKLNLLLNTPTVGASGAVFGILLGFGMLFPNTQLMLLFPPIPIKAKYFVIGYGVIELFLGIKGGGNVAHFAHLGGMIFGYFMIKYWNKTLNRFY